MITILPSWPLLPVFLTASFVLAITPGPCVFYIVTRSLLQGRRFGLASVAGIALGNLANALGASIGLAALFAVSVAAFTTVKYAGALYLLYIGVQTLRTPQAAISPAAPNHARIWHIFRDGFIVALLNPKTAIFFAAFLPQFMGANAVTVQQTVTLGSLFVAIAAITDTTYALAAGAVSPVIARACETRTWGRRLAGGVLIGLGLFSAF